MLDFIKTLATENEIFAALAGGAGLSYVLYAVRTIPSRIISFIDDVVFTSVSVRSDNAAFGWLADWVSQHPSLKRARSLKVVTGRDMYSGVGENDEQSFRLTLGEGHPHLFFLGWRPVIVTRRRIQEVNEPSDEIHFRILGRSHAPIKMLVEGANRLRQDVDKNKSYIVSGVYWEHYGNLTPRTVESVFLDRETEKLLWPSIDNFVKSADKYDRHGVAWKYGIFLHGVPGSGKSTIIRAISTKYKRDIYILSLGSLKSDEQLYRLFNTIEENSIIVIEDIDTFKVSKKRTAKDDDSKSHDVTLSGILNCLDGAMSPRNTILIMTSNHRNVMDPALFRPGRIDLSIELGFAKREQIEKMCASYLGLTVEEEVITAILNRGDVTTALLHTALFSYGRQGLDKIINGDVLT